MRLAALVCVHVLHRFVHHLAIVFDSAAQQSAGGVPRDQAAAVEHLGATHCAIARGLAACRLGWPHRVAMS